MRYLFLFTFTLLLHTQALAKNIQFKLSMPEPHTHYYNVEMLISGIKQKYLDVKMPVWAPGSYLVREFEKSVASFQAYDKNGKILKLQKINKNTWRVYSLNQDVKITYKVYAYEMSVRTSFLDASHGYITGTSVFMYVEKHQNTKHNLEIIPYKAWKKVSTGLKKEKPEGFNYTAPNYDILVDCPIEMGNHLTFTFKAAGLEHEVAMYGPGNFDVARLKEDMAKIVEASTNVFGVNPNDYYLFIIHNLDEGRGGLEHLNSTTLQVSRWKYGAQNGYFSFLGLVAHEYFHLWNVKRIRPLELGPFDYSHENYTSLLWVMEGFTSYYDELLLLRAGLYDQNQYLNKLESAINKIENQPGNYVQPVAHASYDAWIKYYRPNENSFNTTISYYTKGQVLASLIDLEIIHRTNQEKNLDDLMKQLYKKFYEKQKRGFTEKEFQLALEKLTGTSWNQFFKHHVFGTDTIDYQAYYNLAGFSVNTSSMGDKVKFGAYLSQKNGMLIAKTVIAGGSAYLAGINAGDEIIAMDGYRVDKELFVKLIGYKSVGGESMLTISRDGLIMEIPVMFMKDAYQKHTFEIMPNPSVKQLKNSEKWLKKN